MIVVRIILMIMYSVWWDSSLERPYYHMYICNRTRHSSSWTFSCSVEPSLSPNCRESDRITYTYFKRPGYRVSSVVCVSIVCGADHKTRRSDEKKTGTASAFCKRSPVVDPKKRIIPLTTYIYYINNTHSNRTTHSTVGIIRIEMIRSADCSQLQFFVRSLNIYRRRGWHIHVHDALLFYVCKQHRMEMTPSRWYLCRNT